MVRLALVGITCLDSSGNVFAGRTMPRAIGILPSQPILFSWRADDALRELIYVISFTRLKSIFVLCFHVTARKLNRVEFVFANSARKKFLATSFGVKRPLVVLLNNRHWEGPIVFA